MQVGRYAICRKIAHGGMASVHFGRLQGAAGFSRTVAIKRLHSHLAEEPEFLSTMIDEARLAARIHHPNVVPTLDVVSEGGELLVIMEYVRGESLGRLLRAESRRSQLTPLAVVSSILVGALHGLHAAHEATSDRGAPLGIVHRDVSPQNILVGVDGAARIIDFGVAKAAGRLQETRDGVVKGKIAYMAPEQLAGGEVTRRVDLYAIGAVLWEMLTGRRLFIAESDAAMVARVTEGAIDPPSRHAPDLPPGLDELVMTALAHHPANRFATAREMADKLARVVPPALSPEVGEWVEDLARDALSQRAAALAEIEGVLDVPEPPPVTGMQLARARTVPDDRSLEDDATIVDNSQPSSFSQPSQPSSLSVETPSARTMPPWRMGRGRVLAAAVGGAALLALGVVAIAWHGDPGSNSREQAASAPTAAVSDSVPIRAESVAPEPPVASAASTASSPALAASASAVVRPRVQPPTPVVTKRPSTQPAARSTGSVMVRYPSPD